MCGSTLVAPASGVDAGGLGSTGAVVSDLGLAPALASPVRAPPPNRLRATSETSAQFADFACTAIFWWAWSGSVPTAPLIVRKLLNLRMPRRPKMPIMPTRLYDFCTAIHDHCGHLRLCHFQTVKRLAQFDTTEDVVRRPVT